jgi:hypothetical protein
MEDTFGGNAYRFGRLTAMQQFHVARRLAPVITRMAEVKFDQLGAGEEGQRDVSGMLKLMQPLADALGQLSDADSEYVINACMAVVQRKQGEAWAFVWNKGAGRAMFDDIDLPVLLQLTVRVLMENLSGFMPARAPG